jgi:hypothetical protein
MFCGWELCKKLFRFFAVTTGNTFGVECTACHTERDWEFVKVLNLDSLLIASPFLLQASSQPPL